MKTKKQKRSSPKISGFLSPKSREDQKRPKHHQRSHADHSQIIGGDADVDHSQIIGGGRAKLLGDISPHPPRVSAPLPVALKRRKN